MVGDVARRRTASPRVDLKLTIVGCPAADRIERDVRAAAASVPGVDVVDVDVGVMTAPSATALTDAAARRRASAAVRPRLAHPDLSRSRAARAASASRRSPPTSRSPSPRAGCGSGSSTPTCSASRSPASSASRDAKPTQVGDMILPPIAHEREGHLDRHVRRRAGRRLVARADAAPHDAAVPHRRLLRRPRRAAARPAARHGRRRDLARAAAAPGRGARRDDAAARPPPRSPSAAALVARQTGQTVIGVIENMAGELFGSGGGDEVAAAARGAACWRRSRSACALREAGDAGSPAVLSAPDDAAARAIASLAETLATRARGLAGRSLLPFA